MKRATFLLTAGAVMVLTQSSQEFHSRYGEPDVERFQARPGISLTVQYGSDHQACQIIIGPPEPLIHQVGETQFISSDAVSELLEEVAPVTTRGALLNRSSFQSSCAVSYITDYENVSIARGMSGCKTSSPDHDSSTEIVFKREICPKMKNPFGIGQPGAK
jgi:hypothetical protein